MSTTQVVEYKGYPIVGILPELARTNPYELFNKITDEYGDFVKVKIGPKSIYLTTNPDFVQRILRDNHKNYIRPELFYKGVRAALGNGLVTSDGDFWLRQRRMIQPFFHRQFLKKLFADTIGEITKGLDRWEAFAETGQELDLYDEMAHITARIVTNTLFGSGITPEQTATMADDMRKILKYVLRIGFMPFLPDWVSLPGKEDFEEGVSRLHNLVGDIIKEYRENPSDDYNFINTMIHAVDEETNEQMTNSQLLDEAMLFFIAGFETTSTMLTWLFYLLDELPEVLDNLVQEVNDVLGKREPVVEDLRKLTYCKQTMQETMRYRTITALMPRTVVETDMLGDYEVPGGSMLIIWFAGLHRNKNIWENPDKFDPDRFSPERSAGRSLFAFLPFSTGPRTCIGSEFAYMEGVLVIAMILQRYRINVLPNQKIYPKYTMILSPSAPIKVKVEKI